METHIVYRIWPWAHKYRIVSHALYHTVLSYPYAVRSRLPIPKSSR